MMALLKEVGLVRDNASGNAETMANSGNCILFPLRMIAIIVRFIYEHLVEKSG
jgi:hypothetical protein